MYWNGTQKNNNGIVVLRWICFRNQISVQRYSWGRGREGPKKPRRSEEAEEAQEAYVVEPGDRAAPETECVVAVFGTGSWQVHLRAAVIWCSEAGERGRAVRRTEQTGLKAVRGRRAKTHTTRAASKREGIETDDRPQVLWTSWWCTNLLSI